VYPITSGVRKVLVFEFWLHGDACAIDERPVTPVAYDKSYPNEYLRRCSDEIIHSSTNVTDVKLHARKKYGTTFSSILSELSPWNMYLSEKCKSYKYSINMISNFIL